MTFRLNQCRSRWARAALLAYVEQTGVDCTREAIGDLIADLGHYADHERQDFLPLVKRAVGQWRIEQSDADSSSLPKVRIIIDAKVQS